MNEERKKALPIALHVLWLVLPAAAVFVWGLVDLEPGRFAAFASAYLVSSVIFVHFDVLRDRLEHPTRPEPPAIDNYYMILGLVAYLSLLGQSFLEFLKFIAGS